MRAKQLSIIGTSVVAGIILTSGAYTLVNHKRSEQALKLALSAQIRNSATFPVYAPDQGSDSTSNDVAWKIDNALSKYDTSNGIVTIIANSAALQIKMTLTQQSKPDSFDDAPQQYNRMLNALNQYDQLDTTFGTIALTKPKELNGQQTAVINKGDTLLFARPSENLNNSQWQQFFETLRLVR